jgi:4-amino-4-deoxy-L-arabinose transferase-like glycosyltransferase
MAVLKRDLLPLLLIIGLAAILRVAYLGALPLTGAEAYAWQQSQRPDVAYVQGPGGNALLVRLGLTAWGGPPSELAIRIAHAAVGTLAVLIAYLVGVAFFSGPAGLLAAGLLAVGAPFALASRHVSEAIPQFALLLLTLWLLAPLWTSEHAPPVGRVLAAGLAAALLFQVGYVAWLLLPALALSLAVSRPQRLRQGPFWIFCLMALIGIAPWVMWNRAHANIALEHLAALWRLRPPLATRAAALVDGAGLPVALASLLSLAGLRSQRNRALLAPGLALLAGALLWPGDPAGPLVCGLGLLLLSWGDTLHRWADRRLARQQEWFPLRFLVPTLALALLALAAQDAITQTMLPESGVLYRAASEAIYQETAPWTGFPRVRTAAWRHHLPTFEPGPWLVLEDGLAAQMSYYLDAPVYGLGAQQRLWGIPPFQQALIVSGPRIDRDELTWRLRQDFALVEGPEGRWLLGADASPYITLWRVGDPQVEAGALMESYAALRWQVLYERAPLP